MQAGFGAILLKKKYDYGDKDTEWKAGIGRPVHPHIFLHFLPL